MRRAADALRTARTERRATAGHPSAAAMVRPLRQPVARTGSGGRTLRITRDISAAAAHSVPEAYQTRS
ncbi:hypothetical protein GCM10023100_44210 [Actinocorallia cavernae]|uniref:Uncharacterized protein n=2 Tax=Actinomycetes TaxID=1760 RepID=A0ABP8SY49_9ACTN